MIEEIEKMVEQGRPVLVGTTSVEISELLSRMLSLRKIPHNVLNAKLHQKEADIVAQAGRKGVVTIATNMAGRGTDIKLTPEVKAAGGLAIIGTERHESRRVDRQLRGRSGRQGDPGSSVFFISTEDHLMRLFAGDRVAHWLDKGGLKDGEALENSWLSKSVERAQKKVEENNFGVRKRLLDYDDVMNSQREVIYTRRRHALMGERIGLDILNMLYDVTASIVNNSKATEDYEGFCADTLSVLALEPELTPEEYRSLRPQEIIDKLYDQVYQSLNRKMELIRTTAYPLVHKVRQEQGDRFERIIIPITDGRRAFNIPCNLAEADDSECKSIVKELQKSLSLFTLDDAWKEHLREMDELRNSVQNASYENKDPLVIYKMESYDLFASMLDTMNRNCTKILMRSHLPVAPAQEEQKEIQIREAPQERRPKQKYTEQKDDIQQQQEAQRRAGQGVSQAGQPKPQPVRNEHKIGRNDPCPCGSGKKYKNCHGKEA